MTAGGNQASWRGVLLDPLDVLLFRDGRPFDSTNRVVSGTPLPQTVAGAIRTTLLAATGFRFSQVRGKPGSILQKLRDAGADPAILAARFRGPWLAKLTDPQEPASAEPLFACPMNLRTKKHDPDCWLVGSPRDHEANPLSGWSHLDGLWPIEYPADPDPKFEPKLLTLSGLRTYLGANQNGRALVLKEGVDYHDPDALVGLDHRVGIGIDPARLTTVKGELYGIGLMALKPDVRIYVEVELPDHLAELLFDQRQAVALGGEGKYVRASSVEPCDFPPANSQVAQSMWYLATPTFLSDRKTRNRPLPPDRSGKLRAAASDRGHAVSGWDVARGGPRGTRFAVPAGAVYFFESAGSDDGLMEDSQQKQALLQEGWGFAIQGTWS